MILIRLKISLVIEEAQQEIAEMWQNTQDINENILNRTGQITALSESIQLHLNHLQVILPNALLLI